MPALAVIHSDLRYCWNLCVSCDAADDIHTCGDLATLFLSLPWSVIHHVTKNGCCDSHFLWNLIGGGDED